MPKLITVMGWNIENYDQSKYKIGSRAKVTRVTRVVVTGATVLSSSEVACEGVSFLAGGSQQLLIETTKLTFSVIVGARQIKDVIGMKQ
jgi:hypothetical protein